MDANDIIQLLVIHGVTISDLICRLLESRTHGHFPLVDGFLSHSPTLLLAILTHPRCNRSTRQKIVEATHSVYATEVQDLVDVDSGWHFDALHASAGKLHQFRIDSMAKEVRLSSPMLWNLLGLLLGGKRGYTANLTPSTDLNPAEEEDLEMGPVLEGMDLRDGPVDESKDERLKRERAASITLVRLISSLSSVPC